MRQTVLLIAAAIWLASLLGCSAKQPARESKPYSSEEAIDKGDIVFLTKAYNLDKFNRFLANVANKNPDRIRITGFTDEGDPIFKDLAFDGEAISYTYDNSNDQFGGKNKGIRTDTCSEVTSEEELGEASYSLSGCTRQDSEMSYFLLRANKE